MPLPIASRLQFILAFALIFAAANLARAEIEWRVATVSVDVPIHQERVTVSLPFLNQSDRAERPQLGKLPAEVTLTDAPEVAPQKEGVLKLTIEVGHVAGIRTVTIPLAERDADKKPRELTVTLNIAKGMVAEPRHLMWKRGKAVVGREVKITLVTSDAVVLKEAKVMKGDFTCELKPLSDRNYVVVVTPKSTDKAGLGVIRVTGVSRNGAKSSFNLYAEVH